MGSGFCPISAQNRCFCAFVTVHIQFWFIRKDLADQKINIYQYAAEDMLISAFNMQGAESRAVSSVEQSGDNFVIKLTLTQHERDIKQYEALILYAVYCAWWCRKHSVNFACTSQIQEYLDVYYPYIIDWQKPKRFQEEWEIVPRMSPVTKKDIDERFNSFEAKWSTKRK